MATSSSRKSSGMASHSSKPRLELSSSTSPMAWMRALSLLVRLPSPRPVLPLSPVRVAIFESRLPMMLILSKKNGGSIRHCALPGPQICR